MNIDELRKLGQEATPGPPYDVTVPADARFIAIPRNVWDEMCGYIEATERLMGEVHARDSETLEGEWYEAHDRLVARLKNIDQEVGG